jgi:CRP/FNR family cyclic AMP-dependent transcriptional regulator
MSDLHSSSLAIEGSVDRAVAFQTAAALHPIALQFDTGPNADPPARRLFATHPLLTSLPAQERIGLLRWSRLRAVDRRQVIWLEGETASSVIFVLEGHMKLSRTLDDGREAILELVGPGNCLGDMAAVQKRPQKATATSLSSCRLLLTDARQFRQAFERHPDGLLVLLQLADERCHALTEDLLDARCLSASARLAKVLVRLARVSDREALGEIRLPLRLSQSELGALSGMCREFVCRYLRTWRNSGWIQILGGAVVSLHVAALAKLSGEDANEGRCISA